MAEYQQGTMGDPEPDLDFTVGPFVTRREPTEHLSELLQPFSQMYLDEQSFQEAEEENVEAIAEEENLSPVNQSANDIPERTLSNGAIF